MKIKSKLWIEVDGKPVLGKGRMQLLEGIGRHGSISRAAKDLNISYRKAWGYLDAMESRLSIALVDRHAGGRDGGGATLTGEARDFLRKFEQMEEGIKELIDERFVKVFSDKEG